MNYIILVLIFFAGNVFAKSAIPTGHCLDPFDIYRKINKDPEEVGRDLVKVRTDNGSPVVLDIGGEGRFEDAINLNPQFLTSTTGTDGRLIPHWLPGAGHNIPISAHTVDLVHLQNAPINIDTMKEILRVMKPRSKIHLTHPSEYAETYFDDLQNIFEGFQIRRVDDGIMSDFYISQ